MVRVDESLSVFGVESDPAETGIAPRVGVLGVKRQPEWRLFLIKSFDCGLREGSSATLELLQRRITDPCDRNPVLGSRIHCVPHPRRGAETDERARVDLTASRREEG